MQFTRGVSTGMAALAVVVVAVIAGGGVYMATSGSQATVTSTKTVTTGASSGAPSTATNTLTNTVTNTQTNTLTNSVTNTVTNFVTSSVTSSVTSTVSVPGTPQDLVAACKSEGNTVTLYNSFTTTANAIVVTDWNQAFPSITLNAVGLTAATVTSRALTEYQAGHVSADAISNNLASLMSLNASGAIQPYQNYAEQIGGYPPGYTIAPNVIHPSTEDVDLLVYNTKLVTNTATLPKSWSDLTNPIWNGKIAIDNPTLEVVAGEYFATLEPTLGNASWTQLMKGINANNPILTTAASTSLSDLTSGQASLAIVLLSAFNPAVAAGSPVAVVPGFAGQAHVTGISLAKNGPNPACGELLVQWWTSFAGQEMIVQTGRGAQLPSVRIINATQITGFLPSTTAINPPSTVPTTYFSDSAGWASYYNTIFGGLG